MSRPWHFDAVLLGEDEQEVWIAPVDTPVPEEVFAPGVLEAAGFRFVGRLHGVLLVTSPTELAVAQATRDALSGPEDDAEVSEG